ncbi:MAG: phosphatidylglycerophosphatase A [Paracoccaceae bacterium]|jgi:phosphatidylglycerophosphatase A|nr:phosphatidylglycerophosphatase A [Paracoccaceae bacterium]
MSMRLATVFGVGYLKPAPGTWGSLAALPMFWVLHVLGGPMIALSATIAVTLIGWWVIAKATAGSDNHDPSEIVIDEVAGQWVALLPLSFGAAAMGVGILALYPGWIAAFVLFRLFDIRKPGPVGWADRRDDPFGVMFDDVIAGLLAAVGVLILAGLSHGLMM